MLDTDVGAATPLSNKVLMPRIMVVMDPSMLKNEYVLCGCGSRNTLIEVDTTELVNLLNPVLIDAFEQV
ncbi:YbaK/EbsC family protein [Vulcanisaeta souniana]|uniref:YbaK/aminoacyl-tRNA synthetase-associated domain-containing protein n=1 Tax=Vulcanisaeta souniana JCM 11219 TaxID=1293586 RepID=A0A830E7G3_9CREN|nr:YbaK/EbsC family protein [Vulcanisaeta souniana]BDR93452.1 hypothetical protein Vsou_25450 [Vulcanisaeta souniana JCM 11219]GGI77244.1 hypothetical protein GCM10007112_12550 [Vulcanisaeta souniana JCM 11219]